MVKILCFHCRGHRFIPLSEKFHMPHSVAKKKTYTAIKLTKSTYINKKLCTRILRLKIVRTVLWRNQKDEEGAVKGGFQEEVMTYIRP